MNCILPLFHFMKSKELLCSKYWTIFETNGLNYNAAVLTEVVT